MAKTDSSESSETLQIAILTFFMTAGGFLILTLVFTFWFNPEAGARLEAAEKTYQDLAKLLSQEEMRRLRQQDRESKESANDQGLREIIDEKLDVYSVQYREVRPPKRSPTKKGGMIEITQSVPLEPAPMMRILQFVAAVADVRKSIQVDSIDLSRNKRAGEDEDSWQATVIFVDYESEGS